MGNVCSSGQNKNDTDSTSEKSEQSAAYQNADTNKKEAPLVDPEPISDVSVGGHNTILSINPSSANGNNINAATTTTTTTSTNRTSTNNQQQFKSQSTTLNESVSSTPQTTLPPSEPSLLSSSSSVNIDLPVNLLPLQGKPISNRRTEKDKKIILYILSADDDPHKNEKTALYSVYHQILKDYCACHGFEILISDVHRDDGDDLLNSKNEQQQQQQQQRDDINKSSVLDVRKWVNNPLEAQGGHEEAANCLAEISRHSNFSYIIPILFLGNSLGTPLLPLTIESQDFTTALNIISDNSKKLLLEKWYRLDNSAQPQCYRLNTTTKNDIINNLDSDQINIELNQLLTILIEIFSKELCDSYLTTVVEQEINNTVLISQELSKRCIWIQTGSFIMKLPENSNVLEIEMNRRLCTLHMDLKNQLTEKNLIRVPPSVQMQNQLTLILEKHLCTIIDGIIEEHSNKFSIPNCTFGVDKRLLNELECISQYSKFLGQNCANFTVMEKLKNYVTGNSTTPLIIYGSSGSGKSVVIAKLMNNLHTWLPDCYLILRYVNLTEISSHLTSLIGSIAEQISFIVNKKPCRISHTLKSYADFIKTSLESLNKSHHLIIVIDSLDDINGLNSIDWLPIQFSSNIKIIITLSDEKQINNNNDLVRSSSSSLWLMNELKKNENVIPSENFIHLSRLSEEQWTDIISFCGGGGGAADFYAANSSLLLPDKWCQTEEKLPLQAKILWWLAWAGVTDLKNTNLITIIDKFFDVIENKFDKNVTEFIFSILTVAKYGILETDLIALLSELNICKDIPSASKLWFKFCWFIGPMLLHSNQISIMDRKIKFSIMQRYKNKSDEAHHILYLYFKKQDSIFTDKKGKYKCYNTQKLLRLPYHSFTIEQQQDKQQKSFINSIYLTDLQWIYDKLVSSGCVNVLSDIHLILTENELSLNLDDLIKNVNDDHNYIIHIQLLRIFIENNFRELNYDGKQFYALFNSFLQNTIKDYQLETVSSIGSNETIKKWMKFLSNVKTTYLKRLSDFIASNSDDNVNDNDNVDDNDNDEIEKKLQSKGYDFVVNLSGQGYFVASVSTQREEICVWDVSKCKKVRTHKGIPQPTLLCPIGDCDAAVLCRREIKVIDLDNGKFKVTLKGVMNQKMPYFGLHDSKHVVCLSRNRMYVNLMNLESGDCVTTFKAGEDRFLNSLLVSGDGRILVCGDETQKPFPLLVWHLSQRKLLYDLRIPHHDFITSLSAITYEGSYVCVVAKELNEPTPNFIVVYDLQSGTLFKKWKPSCNTVSLAISQTNTCVIAGLEDARILVWDLVTGNCRSTLSGHNAPVTLLKLDPLGKILLSGDKDGRDMSIRLWELDFGKPLAVYTPPTKISACEILSNGIYVVLALVNHPNLITLMLCNYQQQQQQTIGNGDDNNETMVNICSNDNNSSLIIYGNPENEGKIFNLGSS